MGISKRSSGDARTMERTAMVTVAISDKKVDCSMLAAASLYSFAPKWRETRTPPPMVTTLNSAETTPIMELDMAMAARALALMVLTTPEIAIVINTVKQFSNATGMTNFAVRFSSSWLRRGMRSIGIPLFGEI